MPLVHRWTSRHRQNAWFTWCSAMMSYTTTGACCRTLYVYTSPAPKPWTTHYPSLLSGAQQSVVITVFFLVVGSSGDTCCWGSRRSRPLCPLSFKPTTGHKQELLDWMLASLNACCDQSVTERANRTLQASINFTWEFTFLNYFCFSNLILCWV